MSALPRAPLLFYLARGDDPQRLAVGPALAAAAGRAGWQFECYYAEARRGRHYGGGDPSGARAQLAAGSLFAGGMHAERAFRIAVGYEVAALGDPGSPLWPVLDEAGGAALAQTEDPVELYVAALAALVQDVPDMVLVLDAAPQGPHRVVTAPYLYPALLAGEPAWALEASAGDDQRTALERLGVRHFRGLGVDGERALDFPGSVEPGDVFPVDDGWAAFTVAAARTHRAWGRGVLLGDPALVAAQLPRARRLRLLPLHGRPQTDAIDAASDIVSEAREPVFGRQWDDRDFFALASAGHGLQVVDPGPPFDSEAGIAARVPEPPEDEAAPEPGDDELLRWANEGRVLVTLLLWTGMVRELDCIPRLIDLAMATDLRAGLVLTAESYEQGGAHTLGPLGVPVARGGVLGQIEPLLGSTGRGVAAEAYLGGGRLRGYLTEALAAIDARAPRALRPRGWWPLLDARLVRRRELAVGRRGRRPVARFNPRAEASPVGAGASSESTKPRRDLRGIAGSAIRRTGLDSFLEERRPFDGWRPGVLDEGVASAVHGAGLEYMWTKTAFGRPRVVLQDGDFVALPFTAGSWDGWSPFYTVGSHHGLLRAERRLRRHGEPGWLATTIDSPLFAMSGEVLEHGAALHEIARVAAQGGSSGELVNVTPNVVARYARLLAPRG
ncbi:MAG TPA: hypothetical protein VF752_03350 [Thermoleophilaceae bacterium]